MRRGNIKNKSNIYKQENKKSMDKSDVVNDKLDEKESAINLDINDSDTNNKKQNKSIQYNQKYSDKLKIIILIIIIFLLISITVGMIIYKYMNNNITFDIVETPDISNENVIKKESEDAKYLVTFTDMYTLNPLTITNKLHETKGTKKQGSVYIEYVQISGLQDKELEKKINKEIKDNAFYNSEKTNTKQEYHSTTSVQGNFSNILSICTYIWVYEGDEAVFEKEIFLNYNLSTGEIIKFLDLFASNTPMNSIIYDVEYERLAWDTEFNFDMSEKELDNATNMDKRDTSEYEDKILKVINRYKKLDKDKIEFYVTPNTVRVNLAVGDGGEKIIYSIDLYKYIDYVTMYKKFLTDKVLYENIPEDKLLVFNDMFGYNLEYYKIESDNLFISVINYNDMEYAKEEEKELVKKYSQSAVNKKNELMKKHKEKILDEVRKLAKSNKNKGYMARFMPYSYIDDYENNYGAEPLIYISLDGAIEEMNIDYYKENAFKLLAKHNVRPRASIDDILIGTLDYNNVNITSLLYNEDREDVVDLYGYYTLDGKLVAKTYEEVEKYLDTKYTEPEEIHEEQLEVQIYKEEQ